MPAFILYKLFKIYVIFNKKTNLYLMLFFFLFLMLHFSASAPVYGNESPTEAARVFFQSLGYMNYVRSWDYLSDGSQRQWLERMRRKFLDKGKSYRLDELEYLVRFNYEGHRGILFYELFSSITIKMGVKASSFKTAQIALEELQGETAVVRLIVEDKRELFNMVNEKGRWLVVYNP